MILHGGGENAMSIHISGQWEGRALERRCPVSSGRTAIDERSALILAGDEHACMNLPAIVFACGFEPLRLDSIGELRTGALDDRAALVLCEEVLPDGDFRDALHIVRMAASEIPVIVFSRIADWDSYLRAVRLGAYDCLRYPFRRGELQRIVTQMMGAAQAKV
jgi:DNA-binding NtrC family response regulator